MMNHKILSLLFLLLTVAGVSQAAPIRIGLMDALSKNMIDVTAKASGQIYYQRALRVDVKNKSGVVLMLTMDQGVIFSPSDTTHQDLILASAEVLIIQPFKENGTIVSTFCAESHDAAPSADMLYSNPRLGDEKLVQVVQYLKNKRVPDEMGQRAVWVVTNEHNLGSVYDLFQEAKSLELIDFLSVTLGLPKPDYYTKNAMNTAAGQPVWDPKPLHIYAQFELKLEEPKKLTLGVYNSADSLIQGVFENRMFPGKKGHRFKVDFSAIDVPPGNYAIRLKDENGVIEEKVVKVE